MVGFIWQALIVPKSKDKDRSRREFILNIFLLSLILLSSIAFFNNIVHSFLLQRTVGANPLISGAVSMVFIVLLVLSKTGKSNIASSLLISLLLLVTGYVNYTFGADLGASLLLFALTIVMAGILIGTKSAFFVTILSSTSIILFSYLEIKGIINPNKVRQIENVHIEDSILHVIIFGIIATVSWLFNRESEKTLQRARRSEVALKRQRDKLEIIVEKRTAQLKREQVEKLAQLYRFAEFGRLASGLFHDLVNPINLVSLNLSKIYKSEDMGKKDVTRAKIALDRAINGTKRLQGFISGAKKQVQGGRVLKIFSLIEETNQAVQMLEYKARDEGVKVTLLHDGELKFSGNPLKFHQLISNLTSNGIDAYSGVKRKGKKVEIRIKKVNNNLMLSVQDWGVGIRPQNLPKIFDPLFTTKGFERGTGIGLSICRDIVMNDLKGKINVESQYRIGTIFTVEFPQKGRT